MELDAIVLADAPTSGVRIAGLSARERARRVAQRAGARRVLVVEGDRAAIGPWREGSAAPLLVIRADQLVHPPLVAPLVAQELSRPGLAIAVGPDGGYAGALLASGEAAERAAGALARGASDRELAGEATARVPHGEIACHPLDTPEARRGALRLLNRLYVKPQDNAITRYLLRPVSSRISRVLVNTPITPTQVSLVTAVLVALGCWMTLDPRPSMLAGGAAVILFATYLDCCDGEIARIKLQSSTFGAWLDTVIDELSSMGYMIAVGWHCHVYYGPRYFGDLGFDPWLAGIVVGVVTFGWSLYGVYYNIIVAVGSANSQDYVSRFVVGPGSHEGALRLAPKPARVVELPRWLEPIARFLPNIVRRDFIVWLALVYAVLDVAHLSFATHLAGGVVSSVVIVGDHLHLRALRRRARREGKVLEPVRA